MHDNIFHPMSIQNLTSSFEEDLERIIEKEAFCRSFCVKFEWLGVDRELCNLIYGWFRYLLIDKDRSPATIKFYAADLRSFFEFLRQHLLSKVNLETMTNLAVGDIRKWIIFIKIQRGVGHNSAARYLSSLKGLYEYLAKFYQVHNESVNKINIKLKQKGRFVLKTLEPDKAIAATKTISQLSTHEWTGLRDAAIILLMYGSGLRISEALALSASDISSYTCEVKKTTSHFVTIEGKGSRARVVPMLKVVYNAIQKYLTACPFDLTKGHLFIGLRGSQLHPDVLRKQVRTLREVLGLPSYISPNVFRSSFADHIITNGVSLRVVHDLLGRSSVLPREKYKQNH